MQASGVEASGAVVHEMRRGRTVAAAVQRLLPRAADYRGGRGSWRRDVFAGLTVGIVALPLALAFGVTTGLGAAAGLTTAIVAGFVAAVFGGSHVQVSGPTGAMTVVLVPIVARHGADGVAAVAVIAGVLIVVAALAGLGRFLEYMPWPVVEGFTVGIAVIIFLQQVPAALGVPKPEGDRTASVAFAAARDAITHGSVASVALVALVVAVMLVVPRVHRALPASLFAVALATVVSTAADLDVARIGALPDSLPRPSVPALTASTVSELFSAAIAVALLAALESLLSARVADGMSGGARHDPDRELFGQGLANVVAPLFGGMPATGAIARTAVNVRAGARTRVAAIVHSVVLLAVVLFGSRIVADIPLAALAGVLIVTAVRMVERHNVRAVVTATRADATVFTVTAVATVALDLIVAVEIGIAVAALLALRSVARATSLTRQPIGTDLLPADAAGDVSDGDDVSADDERRLLARHIVAYRIDGALFFGASQRFLTELVSVADVRVVILRLPELQVLDATGAHALREIVDELHDRGVTVLLKGPRDEHLRTMAAVGALAHVPPAHVFADLDAAVGHAREHVSGPAPTCAGSLVA